MDLKVIIVQLNYYCWVELSILYFMCGKSVCPIMYYQIRFLIESWATMLCTNIQVEYYLNYYTFYTIQKWFVISYIVKYFLKDV